MFSWGSASFACLLHLPHTPVEMSGIIVPNAGKRSECLNNFVLQIQMLEAGEMTHWPCLSLASPAGMAPVSYPGNQTTQQATRYNSYLFHHLVQSPGKPMGAFPLALLRRQSARGAVLLEARAKNGGESGDWTARVLPLQFAKHWEQLKLYFGLFYP